MDNDTKYPLPGNENGKRATYSHDVIAGKALDFIRGSKDGPFFCYVPFTIPQDTAATVPVSGARPLLHGIEERIA